ncbi:hypothetical protein EJB05_49638, partial [Eragrostis curvula]
MARFLLIALLAAVSLLAIQARQLSDAGPSTAEVFWRAVMPDSPLPDSIRWLLHPGNQAAQGGSLGHHGNRGVLPRGIGSCGRETLPVLFPPARRAPLGLLPRDVADSIPFSSSALPDALARLGVAAGSAQAAEMEKPLGMCETPSLAGEAKFCATSLEAMVQGPMAGLGTNEITPVTSPSLPRSGAPLQPFAVRAMRRIDGSRFVACHGGLYPYTVFMCHDTGAVRAYMADMEGARDGGKVTVAIVCHTDTSLWDPEHMSFRLLGTKPGGEPVCHFMPYGHIMFAKNNATTRSSA